MSITDRLGNVLADVAIKPPCRVATTANVTLSGLQTIDGVALAAADRVLVWQQDDATENGIWAAQTGSWNRPSDAKNNSDFFQGTLVLVSGGDSYVGTLFAQTCSDNPVVIDTSLITFENQSALMTALQRATSTTSLAIGTGSKTLAIQSGKAFTTGQWVLVQQTSNAANQMLGQITSYSGGTLIVSVAVIGGSGTHDDWTVVLTNSPAAAGYQPPAGTGNVTGPGSSTAGHAATFADSTGKVLSDGGALGTMAQRTSPLLSDFAASTVPASALAPDTLRGPIIGQPGVSENFLLSNDVTNATRDFDVGPGRCEDSTFTSKLRLKGTMVKRLDQAWVAGGAAGTPVGGTDAGGVKGASQTLHAYVIGKPGLNVTQFSRTSNVATITIAAHGLGAGGTIEVQGCGSGIDASAAITAVATNTVSYANSGADVGATSCSGSAAGFDVLFSRQDANGYPTPSMPTGWTLKQCLGSVLTDGSGNIRAVTHVGDEFLLTTPVGEILNTAPGDTLAHTLTLTGIPLGVAVFAKLIALDASGAAAFGYLSALVQADQAPSLSAVPGFNYGGQSAIASGGNLYVLTNASAQVRYRLSANNLQTIITQAWRDPRRRLF